MQKIHMQKVRVYLQYKYIFGAIPLQLQIIQPSKDSATLLLLSAQVCAYFFLILFCLSI